MSLDAGDAPAPVAAPAETPAPERPREVVAFGRRWPRALPFERAFWLISGQWEKPFPVFEPATLIP